MTKEFSPTHCQPRTSVQAIEEQIEALNLERRNFDRRLDFLLADEDDGAASQFRDEYKEKCKEISETKSKLEEKVYYLIEKIKDFEGQNSDLSDCSEVALKAIDTLSDNDIISLRSLYKNLFKGIVVGKPDKNGKRSLKFILNEFCSSARGRVEDFFCVLQRVVEMTGIEPATFSLPARRSPN